MINALTPFLSSLLPGQFINDKHLLLSPLQAQPTNQNKLALGISVALMALSQPALAHIEYYDLNQGKQIGDLTSAGKTESTLQYGKNPVITGGGVGSLINEISDRPLNNKALWNETYQTYTGVGSFSGVTYDATTGFGSATVNVNDVTDFGWGAGTQAVLGDTHKVDFFNFRLAQDAEVTITWNVDESGSYIDNGFTLYKGVASFQAHDDSSDILNPKSGLQKVQNAFDTGSVKDAQGILQTYRNTLTNALPYVGQFDSYHKWGDGNAAGNWSAVEFVQAAHVLRGSVGAQGYSKNPADTRQTLSLKLLKGNYIIAASGALGAPGSQVSLGLTNLHGELTFKAVPATAKKTQTLSAISFLPATLTAGKKTIAKATSSAGLVVTFSSLTPSKCAVSGKLVTGKAVGTCTIVANQAGNTLYSAAAQTRANLSIKKGTQIITFAPTPVSIKKGASSNISATASSGLKVVFSTTSPTNCKVTGNVVKGLKAGVCSIIGRQAGNTSYFLAPAKTKKIAIKP